MKLCHLQKSELGPGRVAQVVERLSSKYEALKKKSQKSEWS
jgi:hypothetical protein